MAYQYPYDEELRKVSLNPEMIRYRVEQDAKRGFIAGTAIAVFIILFSGLFLALFCPLYSWTSGTLPLIFGVVLALAFGSGIVIGIGLFVSALKRCRRAARGEIVIEIDALSYIEHDRPRVVNTGRRYKTVYEDFLHFKSGREFCDPRLKYRHNNKDDEEFITVAYAAEPQTILFIYRLSDYNWQP